jgi:hypothetical protein
VVIKRKEKLFEIVPKTKAPLALLVFTGRSQDTGWSTWS